MNATLDSRVDDYVDALPEWQQAICREVRELVHAADPEVEETIKRRVQPNFVLEGNVCSRPSATSASSSTTARSFPTRRGSSPADTATRARARSQSMRETRSTHPRSRRCSRRSSPTTAPGAGASSRPSAAADAVGDVEIEVAASTT